MITQRQLQVLRLYAEGNTSIEIACALSISVRTVEEHLRGSREALGAKNSTHAVAIAIRQGIVSVLMLVSFYQGAFSDYSADMRRPQTTRIRVSQSARREC